MLLLAPLRLLHARALAWEGDLALACLVQVGLVLVPEEGFGHWPCWPRE